MASQIYVNIRDTFRACLVSVSLITMYPKAPMKISNLQGVCVCVCVCVLCLLFCLFDFGRFFVKRYAIK